jgi:oligopeptide/dipeptide ABC transporter ATP-binding protein
VARHAGRLLVLYSGRVVEEARTADFFLAPRHPYSRALLDSVPRLSPAPRGGAPFRAIPGTVPDLATRPADCCAFFPRCPERFEPCDRRVPDLYPVGSGVARCFLYGGRREP